MSLLHLYGCPLRKRTATALVPHFLCYSKHWLNFSVQPLQGQAPMTPPSQIQRICELSCAQSSATRRNGCCTCTSQKGRLQVSLPFTCYLRLFSTTAPIEDTTARAIATPTKSFAPVSGFALSTETTGAVTAAPCSTTTAPTIGSLVMM